MFGIRRTLRAMGVPADAVRGPDSSNRFIGGLSGRSGTSWMNRSVLDVLGAAWAGIGEHGSFSLSQTRRAAEDLYQVTPGSTAQREAFLRYFRAYALGPAAHRRRIYGEGVPGWGRFIPRRGIELAVKRSRPYALAAKSLDDAYRAFGQFYSGLLDFAAYLQSGTVAWVSKEPSYGRHLLDVYRMMPDCRVVVMVRNGGDVALSMSRRGWQGGDVRRCIDRWASYAEMSLNAFDTVPAERFQRVRYEAMLEDPAGVLEGVLSFFGIDEPATRIAQADLEAATADNAGKWKSAFSVEEARYFEARCGSIMERLGYG